MAPRLQELACEGAGWALGFVELSIFPYAEGWFVDLKDRIHGVGAALIKAAETWATEQNCKELASDTAIDNKVSEAAHRALGFQETIRTICFRKDL